MPSLLPPGELPRWATNPPVAPPSTITEPTEPEKDVGFQPGSQAQVDDFVITNVLNSHTYNATVNGIAANFTSPGGGNTAATISTGVVNALTAAFAATVPPTPITASSTGVAARVTANVAGQAFLSSTTDGANISITHVTPNRSGKPIRQYMNWILNLICQWLAYWYVVLLQWSDVGGLAFDVVSGGVLPGPLMGGTLVGNSGTALSYVRTFGGFGPPRRALGLTEAHTYGATSDTYVDLNYDGTFTYTAVANGAGAPSISSTARRQWMIRTDGTQITLITDLRVNAVNLSGTVPWTFGNLGINLPPAQLLVNSGDVQTAKLAVIQTGVFSYTEMMLGASTTGTADVRRYLTSFGGEAIAIGCYWNNATARWLFDAAALTANPSHAAIYMTDNQGSFWAQVKTVGGATSATAWTDTIGAGGWDDQAISNYGRFTNIGGGLRGTLANALLARLAVAKAVNGTAPRTLLLEDIGGNDTLRIYLSNGGASGGFAMGSCIEFVRNAFWDGSNTRWQQDVAGGNRSSKTEIGIGGTRELTTTAAGGGGGGHLTDVIDNGNNWTLVSFANAATGQVADGYSVGGRTSRSGGSLSGTAGTGFSLSLPDTHTVRVTLARAMPSTAINVQVTNIMNAGGIGTYVTNPLPVYTVIDASHVDIQFITNAGVLLDISLNPVTFAFTISPIY